MCYKRLPIFFVLLLVGYCAFAQPCPTNLSFEEGTFNHWKCYAGNVSVGDIDVALTDPIGGRHTIWKNSSPQSRDPYGDFPVNCPNGSNYSIQLGNSAAGHQAERISYTYTIPADQQNFTLVYFYAVVLQNFNHPPEEQPKFSAKLTDLTTGKNIECDTHDFVASAGLQGFKTSALDRTVVYKDWSPVVINLVGCAGHTIQMDFTTNDCTHSAHFGYAYLDFNDICDPNYNGLIVGNKYCNGSENMTLTAPPGFAGYKWYDPTSKEVLGTDNILKITPVPTDGTKYALEVTPFPDLGCVETFYTTAKRIDEDYVLKVAENMAGCKADGIDLTQASVTSGSSAGMKLEYYTDAAGQNFLSDPKRVVEPGDYYIRGTNAFGCTDIAKVHLDLYDGAVVTVTTPPPVCFPATIDLTSLATTNEAGVTFTYYSDALLKKQLTTAQAQAINKTGTYYIKVVSFGVPCVTVKSVNLIVSTLPVLSNTPINYSSCPPLDLNKAMVNAGDNGGITYKFYMDAAGTIPVANPAVITVSGNFYYKAINEYGCESINKPLIKATVVDPPTFKVTDPDPVVFPQTINLADTHIPLTYAEFTYWKDAAATKRLDNYQTISESGTYYIKAINSTGCIVINPVHVLVNAPPEANLIVANTFTPNGDGINDEFKPTTVGVITLNYIKIFNRYGKEIYETKHLYDRWNGTTGGKPEPAGTYYWLFSAYDIYRKRVIMKSGSVTIIR